MLGRLLPVAFVGCAILTSALAALTWRKRYTTGSTSLFGALVSVTVWLLTALAAILSTSGSPTAYRFVALALLGVSGTIACMFLFALRYSGFSDVLSGRRVLVLGIHPVAFTGLTLTNEGTGLGLLGFGGHTFVIESITPAAGIVWGPVFWVHLLYAYLLVAASTVLVVRTALQSNDGYRGQTVTILVAILVPWAANAADILFDSVDNLLVFGFSISAVLLTVSVHWFDLTDYAPVARPAVMDTMQDGVVVVDQHGRIRDVNAQARTFLDVEDDTTVLGERPAGVFPQAFVAFVGSDADSRDMVEIDGRVFDVDTSRFGDSRDTLGHVYVLRDVTEQHAYRRELERKTERLDRFASVVSHDLRNPLAVAEGYLELLEETGDLAHTEPIAESHDRMGALVEDLLAVARTGNHGTDPERIALDSLAERAWKTVDTGDSTLVTRADVVVEADPDRTVQLFENLFRNSVEHGSTGNRENLGDSVEHGSTESTDDAGRGGDTAGESSVTVTVGSLPDGAGFFVADDGPGLPRGEARSQLFESGVSGDGGTGLGLAIVTRIAEGHGWTVEAVDGEDGGARFEVRGVTVESPAPAPA